MKTPSLAKPLRPSIPWLIAGLSSMAIIALVMSINTTEAPQMSRESPERITATKPAETTPASHPRRSLEELLISALALIPKQTEAVPLVAAVIENHEDARPHQQGLRDAIAVFELIVEGDISRFLAFFRSDRLPGRIGPVRSLRTHFVDIALGYRPLLLHAGGHRLAYEALEHHPELPHHDGIRYDGETYVRDPAIAPPHNLFMPREALQGVLETYDVAKVSLPLFGNPKFEIRNSKFEIRNVKCKMRNAKCETARKVSVGFGSPIHDVTFTYTPFSGAYSRSTGNAPAQAKPVNIVILEARIEGFGDRSAIPWTQTFGGGRLLLFSRGTMREGRWAREKEEPFSFLDAEGKPSGFAKGQTWVMMLPGFEKVEWE